MSYGLKYTGTLIDYYNRTLEVNIYENNYAGSDTEVTLAGVSKELNGSDENVFINKLPNAVKVGLISQSNFQFIELYTGDKRKFKLQIELDSVLKWTGWITPELFTEPYDTPPYVTVVTARDGLNELESLDFELTGVKTHIEILSYILAQIADINFNVAVNLYEENHSTSLSPLSQTYNDCERFEEMNCKEVLDSLLNIWGARIYLEDGEWWIVNTIELRETLNYFEFTSAGASVTSSTRNNELAIGLTENNKWSNVDQQLNILPAYRSIPFSKDLGLKQAIANNKFDEWDKVGTGYKLSDWVESAVGLVSRTNGDSNEESDFAVQFDVTQPSYTSSKFITQTILNFVASSQICDFSIKFKNINYNGDVDFWVKIEMWDGASAFRYLQDDGTWTSVESYIEFQNVTSGNAYDSNYQTNSIPVSGIPITGRMFVYIYASTNGNLIVDEFSFDLRQLLTGQKYTEIIEGKTLISTNNIYIPETTELLISDVPDKGTLIPGRVPSGVELNEQHNYLGVMFLDSGKEDVTQRWQTKRVIDLGGSPFTYARQLDDLVRFDRIALIYYPRWAITGSLLGQDFKIDSAISDTAINNNKYVVCNGNYDFENCTFNGTFIEIGSYSGGDWILETGAWDDNGIWIDVSLWKDN